MKKDDVRVGGTYSMTISGKAVPVRVTDEKWKGEKHVGWVGVNLQTNRSVRIKSAQALKAEAATDAAQDATGDAAATGTPETPAGEPAPQTPTSGTPAKRGRRHKSGIMIVGEEPGEGDAGESPADAPAAKGKKAKAPKPPTEPKPKKVSALDAAAQVLADAGKAMSAKELIAEMAAKNLWTSPGGKTPEATLYAAIIREISAKGTEARFRKVDRGMFESRGK